jgi:hypothetical protein
MQKGVERESVGIMARSKGWKAGSKIQLKRVVVPMVGSLGIGVETGTDAGDIVGLKVNGHEVVVVENIGERAAIGLDGSDVINRVLGCEPMREGGAVVFILGRHITSKTSKFRISHLRLCAGVIVE